MIWLRGRSYENYFLSLKYKCSSIVKDGSFVTIQVHMKLKISIVIFALLTVFAVTHSVYAAGRITLNPSAPTIDEGDDRIIEIRLVEPIILPDLDAPQETTITFTSTDPSRLTIADDVATYLPSEWAQVRYVTLVAEDDATYYDLSDTIDVNFIFNSGSEYYNNYSGTIHVTINDNDPDGVAPTVDDVSPSDGATGVSVNPDIVVIFSESIDTSSLMVSSGPCSDACPSYDEVWSDDDTVLTLIRNNGAFSKGVEYSIDIFAEDVTHNPMDEHFVWSFKIAKSLGGGGRSSRYREEMLKKVFEDVHVVTHVVAEVEKTKLSDIVPNLFLTVKSDDVKMLQEFLIAQNKGTAAAVLANIGATGYFGAITKSALIEFQKSTGISPAAGYFGPITKMYLKSMGF